MKRYIVVLLLLITQTLFAQSEILHLKIEGIIGPANSQYLQNGLQKAQSENSDALLVTLDTPGGLSTSMREMIQAITNSSIPVIMYVYPKGSRAASAGTYLLYASHVAAMASGTNLGAASPVNMMPGANDRNSTKSTLEKKAMNDASAYIQSLAELNDRNVTWAIEAVRHAKSLSATDALRYGVIDVMADDIPSLFKKIDKRVVKVNGVEQVLHTKGARVVLYEASWKTKFLSLITNPNIAYIFMLIAIYGIFFELMNPGSVVPGVMGAISGVIALYSLNMLPFNYAGLFLMALGISFMIAELFVSGFGILGIGGVIAFAFGSVLLFDAHTLGHGISIPLIIAFSLVSLGFFLMVIRMLIRSRSAKIVSGSEEMIGACAKVLELKEDGYKVLCHGEIWSAKSDESLQKDQEVAVEALQGLVLQVKSKKE